MTIKLYIDDKTFWKEIEGEGVTGAIQIPFFGETGMHNLIFRKGLRTEESSRFYLSGVKRWECTCDDCRERRESED